MSLTSDAHWNNYDPSSFGWPHRVPRLVPLTVGGVSFGQCAADAHGLLVSFLTDLEPLIDGGFKAGSCWCYSTTDDLPDGSWSFHRYGIAVDVDWNVNHMGEGISAAQGKYAIPHAASSALARRYGMEYGGDWHGFKDFMHFEIHVSPMVARQVGAHYAPSPTTPRASRVTAASLALTDSQFTNAKGIVAAVHARNWPVKAAYIATEAALDESGLRVLASANVPSSVNYPHDRLSWTSDGLGHDHASIGMYQQQVGPSYSLPGTTTVGDHTWGTPAELMDPETGTGKFLDALARVDGWRGMTNWAAAQAVQGSAFPDGSNYRAQDGQARRIVDALWNATTTVQEDDMAELIRDHKTGAHYLVVPGRPVMRVTWAGGRAYARLLGIPQTYRTETHAVLKGYDARMRNNYSGVQR